MKAMMRKIVTMALVVALTAGVAITGTLAYLTDRDSKVNVFTVGDVEIELNEDFEQGETLVPGVKLEKKPTITNTGKNDAWVWATIAIPSALDNEDASKNVIHFNYSKDPEYSQEWTWKDSDDKWIVGKETINGIEHNVYTVLYQKPLKSNEETSAVIHTVYMDAHIDIDPDGNWYHVENGVAQDLEWNSDREGNPVIYVSAYAIQAEGFATVQDAYDAYAAQWTTAEGVNNGLEYADVIVASPESGAVRPAGYAPATEGETIDGLIIMDGSDDETNLRALYKNGLTGDLIVKNSVLDGTYAMNVTAVETEDVALVVENTTFMGWTSYSGFDAVSFTDCTFKLNSEGTYNFVRAYDNTTFTNCEFAGTELDLADSMVEKEGTVTLINCTYNGTLITADNLADLLHQDAENSLVVISNN